MQMKKLVSSLLMAVMALAPLSGYAGDFVAVTEIVGVPEMATAGIPLELTGTVVPSDAINQRITWRVVDDGGTGATIRGNTFTAPAAGEAVIRATIGDRVKAISAGGYYTIALKTDGSLWAWGSNENGQLGDGTNTNRKLSVQIGTETDWFAISAGSDSTIALKMDGSLWAWGSNYYGQLGDGTTTNRNAPVQIGTDYDWSAISAGSSHTIALKTDGSFWAWGRNVEGQLGDGATTNRNVPVQIIAGNYTQDFTITVSAAEETALPDLRIVGFNLVARNLAAPGQYNYVISAIVENQGGAADGVTAVLTGWQSGATAAGGQTLSFGRVESGERVTSANTVTIRLNMTVAMDYLKLVFDINY